MRPIYGGVLTDARHRLLVRKPRDDRDGWTFAHGPALPGEAPESAVLRVVAETTGYAAELLHPLQGAFEGEDAVVRYWILRPGRRDRFRYELTEAVTWVSAAEAQRLLEGTPRPGDRRRDLAVLDAVLRGWRRG